jgi:hypothetical protein
VLFESKVRKESDFHTDFHTNLLKYVIRKNNLKLPGSTAKRGCFVDLRAPMEGISAPAYQ